MYGRSRKRRDITTENAGCLLQYNIFIFVLLSTSLQHRDLIQRDYDLSWAGTNAHFMFGMFSFAYLIAVRSYFNVGGGVLGRGVAGIATASLVYMVSIINRGVASGSGVVASDSGDKRLSYGTSVLSLFRHYGGLILARKSGRGFRPLELGAVALMVVSLITVVWAILQESKE